MRYFALVTALLTVTSVALPLVARSEAANPLLTLVDSLIEPLESSKAVPSTSSAPAISAWRKREADAEAEAEKLAADSVKTAAIVPNVSAWKAKREADADAEATIVYEGIPEARAEKEVTAEVAKVNAVRPYVPAW